MSTNAERRTFAGHLDPCDPGHPNGTGLVESSLIPELGATVAMRGRFEAFATPVPIPAASLLLFFGVGSSLVLRGAHRENGTG